MDFIQPVALTDSPLPATHPFIADLTGRSGDCLQTECGLPASHPVHDWLSAETANAEASRDDEEVAFAARVGAWIHSSRRLRGLSQQAMADAAGVHRNTLLKWERGEVVPNAYRLSRMRKFVAEVAR